MVFGRGGIGREIGSALAVLAIYVLTLLFPLHQASALQRDLGRIGYETIGAWSVCAPHEADRGGDPLHPALAKCPAAGIGKNDLAILPPVPVAIVPPAGPALVLRPEAGIVPPLGMPDHVGQPRAPPVT
jgi:hypothetical protein